MGTRGQGPFDVLPLIRVEARPSRRAVQRVECPPIGRCPLGRRLLVPALILRGEGLRVLVDNGEFLEEGLAAKKVVELVGVVVHFLADARFVL